MIGKTPMEVGTYVPSLTYFSPDPTNMPSALSMCSSTAFVATDKNKSCVLRFLWG